MNPHDQAVILTLAKVLVATAWVDGDLSHDEINAMKFGLLSRIPNLSTEQWASVTIYMDSPVDQAERARLIEQLQAEVSTPAGKQLVFDALDSLVAADGQVTTRNVVSRARSRSPSNRAAMSAWAASPGCSRGALPRNGVRGRPQPRGLPRRLHQKPRLLRHPAAPGAGRDRAQVVGRGHP
ncbi:MAG: TerB family tellurite resistance protein [Anaerolineae bacterium]|nr:MAG: TerB family tellurite resistance protein [Anaerolineae bacterium]